MDTMVFDWHKAATLIKERGAYHASAGLAGGWEYTGGVILENGRPVTNSHTYLASTWATPQLEIYGDVIDCFIMQDESLGWDEDTKWPESAIAILGA